ncbi:hypothetical protein [Halobacterium salinarum]|uniref:hypothetical protein n=1 Tax=Halobacterium salinarum TaxID=2242 RepID=UPI003D77180E
MRVILGGLSTTEQNSDERAYQATDNFGGFCEIAPRGEFRAEQFLNRLRALRYPPYDNACIEANGEQYYVGSVQMI